MVFNVTDITLPELEIYASKNEVQLKHLREPDLGIFIAETPNVILRALHAGYEAESLLLDEKYLQEAHDTPNGATGDMYGSVAEILALAGDVPVYSAPMPVLSAVSGFKQTRGVLCAMKRKPLPAPETVLSGANRVCVLENIENPTNVGAIFRSAAALGMDAVIMTYRSADPLYRRSARVSMGTVFQIPWTFVGNKWGGWPEPGMETLHAAGFQTVSMALTERTVSLDDPALRRIPKLALLFGNEENGLNPKTLAQSDWVVKIPMAHGVDSLNVAAASAVAFWELRRRNNTVE